MDRNGILLLGGLAVAGAVLVYGIVRTADVRPQIARPSEELLKSSVTSCNELAREIETMTQTTAELRKVLRDMEYLTCALPASGSLAPPYPPIPKDDSSK